MGKDYQGCLITPIRLSTAQFVRSACASVHCASFYSRALSLSLSRFSIVMSKLSVCIRLMAKRIHACVLHMQRAVLFY